MTFTSGWCTSTFRCGYAASSTAPSSRASSMLLSAKLLSLRLALTLNVRAARSVSRRYSTAVSPIERMSFSHTAARASEAMPKIFDTFSNARSMSAPSSSGSAYMVDCALYTRNSPAAARRRRIVLSSTLSNVARLRPLRAISPW